MTNNVVPFPQRKPEPAADRSAIDPDILRQIEQIESSTGRRVSVVLNHGWRVYVETFDPDDRGVNTEVIAMWIINAAVRSQLQGASQ